jgi:hypothetical protein
LSCHRFDYTVYLMKDAAASEVAQGASALPNALSRWVRRSVWLLPVWGLLLVLSTLTHQPDFSTDFEGYARYITTTPFLLSHLLASIGGAALGCIGAVALGVHLATSRAPRMALWGMAAFAASQVVTSSVFGVAAFFQPALGRAYLQGQQAVAQAINSDVYLDAPELFAVVGAGILLMIAGAVLLGWSAARAGVGPAWAGVLFAVAVPVFAIGGQIFGILHTVAGLAIVISSAVLARAVTASRVAV